MKFKNFVPVFLILCFSVQIAYTQSVKKEDNFFPKSPNATMSQKFKEFPVNYNTGLPSIEIPLCSLDPKGISVPVALMDHAESTKTNQEITWIGLGRSLECGDYLRTIVSIGFEK